MAIFYERSSTGIVGTRPFSECQGMRLVDLSSGPSACGGGIRVYTQVLGVGNQV